MNPFGIGKAFFVEFPFAQPVGLEPAGVQVDYIAGVMLGTHPVAYLINLISTEISHAAHPDAEAPEGRHRRISGQIPIARRISSIVLPVMMKTSSMACRLGTVPSGWIARPVTVCCGHRCDRMFHTSGWRGRKGYFYRCGGCSRLGHPGSLRRKFVRLSPFWQSVPLFRQNIHQVLIQRKGWHVLSLRFVCRKPMAAHRNGEGRSGRRQPGGFHVCRQGKGEDPMFLEDRAGVRSNGLIPELYIDKCPLYSVLGGDNPFTFYLCYLQREFLYPVTELEHFRLIRHAFFTESDKEPGDA